MKVEWQQYKKELGNLLAIRGQKYKRHYLDKENETLKNEFYQCHMLYTKKLSYHKQVLAAYKRWVGHQENCLLYTSPSPRDLSTSRMPSSA